LKSQKPREIAFRVLLKREQTPRFTENLLDEALLRHPLPPADRALCQELVYGCIRWQLTLDHLIDLRTDGRRQASGVRIALRLGLYQLFWLDRVPQHAAVHETVAVAKHNGQARAAGFINAVLRHYAREFIDTRRLLSRLKSEDPAVGHSHPRWLVDRWTGQFGTTPTLALLEWNNRPAPTFARVNTLKVSAERLTARWQRSEGVEFAPVARDWLPAETFFELRAPGPLTELESFRNGWFYLQDPSTALACRMLDPQPGEDILDLCAAPGGKSTLLAQMVRNQARITAHDPSPARLRLLRENCRRLGAACVTPVEHPPRARFDKILIDAPCSNTGVLRRRVDLRWRLSEGEISRLAEEQRELIERAKQWLKPGGRLIYSTCSIEPEENTAGLRFVESRQLTPFADEVDGAFAGILRD